MQLATRFASLVVTAVVLLAGCGGTKSPRAKPPEMHTWVPKDAPYAFAMLEPLDIIEVVRLYERFGDELSAQMRGTLGPDEWEHIRSEFAGKGTAAGLESLGFAPRMHFAIYGDGKAHVARFEVKDGAALVALVTRIAKKYGEAVPPGETAGEWRSWQVSDDSYTFFLSVAPTQVVIAIGPPADITRIKPTLLGTKPAHSLADTGELFAARDAHHPAAQAIGIADTARLLAAYTPEGRQAGCATAIDAFAKRIPRSVVGLGFFPDRHELVLAIDFAPDLLEELRQLRVSLPPLAAASPDLAPAQRPLLSMAFGADVDKARLLVSSGMNAIKRFAQACHLQEHVEGANEALEVLRDPIPAPFDSITGVVVVANKLVFPKGAMLPTEIDGFALVTGRDLSSLFGKKQMLSAFLELDFELDGELHPVPLRRLPFPLPYEVSMGGTPRTIAVAVGKRGRADAHKALRAQAALAPLLFIEADYAALQQIDLDHPDDDDDDDDDKESDEDGNGDEDGGGLGSVGGGGDADTSADTGDDSLRKRISIELYTRALSTLDVGERSLRWYVRYDRRR